MINYKLLNGANLALIGDAYYELYIRKYIIDKGLTNQHQINELAKTYVSAKAHHLIIKKIFNDLNIEEQEIFKRGRNYKYSSRRKNIDIDTYLDSSGYEAVIGYLYLNKNNSRLDEIIVSSIKVIEEEHE